MIDQMGFVYADGLCAAVFCGQGTCKNINTWPGFECDCYSGWNKIQIGPLTFPSCLIPNCEFLSFCYAKKICSFCNHVFLVTSFVFWSVHEGLGIL